jgi:Na+/H+-dicarboxylate symporter
MGDKKRKAKFLALHWQILIGMALGLGWSLVAVRLGWQEWTLDWIKPFGTIFMRMLKMVAVPLVLVSLIQGVGSLADLSALSRMGLKTITLYMFTTVVAISLGLGLSLAFEPGKALSPQTREQLLEKYGQGLVEKQTQMTQQDSGPLQFLVDLVPENFFKATSDNTFMLQVIVFALFFGVALIMVPRERVQVVRDFFDGANDIILKMVDLIMLYAPIGVTGLMAGVLVEISGNDPSAMSGILWSLLGYSLTVVLGLFLLIFGMYPILLMAFLPSYRNWETIRQFYAALMPVQMLAFSTSSSAATLPLNMERCEETLGLKKQTVGFVLPLGATINMDGTSLYQAVATVFIAQAFGMDLTLGQLGTIVLTAVLASVGSAAVPGAGMVMLVIVLSSIGLSVEGISLIMATDRILDMLRTVANVTSDAVVATIVDAGETKTQ